MKAIYVIMKAIMKMKKVKLISLWRGRHYKLNEMQPLILNDGNTLLWLVN